MTKLTTTNNLNKLPRLLAFGYTSFLLLWTLALVGELLFAFFTHNLSLDQQGSQSGFTDFVHFYVAGKITLSPERIMFYSWEVQKHFLENLTHCVITGEDFYTQYVPLVFLLMAPYATLPMESAHLLFDTINLTIGLIGCWFLMKELNLTKNRMAYLVILGALSSMPSWNTWYLGQISWLYVGIICFYFAFLLKQKNLWSGLAFALTIIKPHYALFLAIPTLILGRYRLILFALLWEFLLLLLCVTTFGIKAILAYPFALNQCESTFKSIHMNTMYGMASFLSFFFSKTTTYYTGLVLLAIALFSLTLFFMLYLKKNSEPNMPWLLSSIVLAALLFSPHSHSHDCLFILIPALITLPLLQTNQGQLASIKFWQWSFYLMPIITWVVHLLTALDLPANAIFTALMLVLFIIAVKQFTSADYPSSQFQKD